MGFKKSIQYYFAKKKRISETRNKCQSKISIPLLQNKKIDLPQFENPEISIIIYQTDSLKNTKLCIQSIFTHLPKISFEILVITHSKETISELKEFGNIRIVESKSSNKRNDLNTGINESIGNYIYFIEGNSIVKNDFLDSLFKVFKTKNDVAGVGSKILQLNGEVYEAGGFILRDQTFIQRNNLPSYFPEYNFLQIIDFCSCNGFLIPKYNQNGEISIIQGDFDSHIYYDINLCLSLKSNSNKNIYFQPNAELIQLADVENSIFNPEDSSKINSIWNRIFIQIKSASISERSSELYNHQQILFFHYKLPEFENSSGDLRYTEIMKEFIRLGFQCSILCTKNLINNPYNKFYQELGICVIYEHINGNELSDYLKRNYFNKPIAWFYSIITFNKYFNKVNTLLSSLKIVFDMVDIHHLRIKRALELDPKNKKYKKEYPKFLKLERWASEISDVVIPISETEAEYMNNFCAKEKLVVISNIHYPKVSVNTIPPFEERSGLIFVGSRHSPNIDAVNYLVDDIMPLVWNQEPSIELHIVGDINTLIPLEKQKKPKLYFHGFVPDIKPFLLKSRIMVAPLRYGAGVKGKVGQAFEFYLPVITSTIGAEGMSLIDNENALLAENATEFAEKILLLHADKVIWLKLQANSELSLAPFSIQKLQSGIQKIIKK